ncbi:MAG: glutamyl-tRNA reductase [Desulfocurvibacter africanus]
MNANIHLIGLNHRTAGVDIREKYALSSLEAFEKMLVHGPVREALALSTCNRVEILIVSDGSPAAADHVLHCWAEACSQPVSGLVSHTYIHENEQAVQHLFRVAGSLDSMVLGEPQILGQLKEAYRKAVESGTAKIVINRLLHKAFFVAKRIRSETGVASSAVSISYAAVALARKIFGELQGKRAMLIGAGEMAELAAMHLLGAGIEHICVANRTFARAEELATRFKGTAIPFDALYSKLPEVDIVISSTGAPTAVIHARDMKQVLKKRRHKPMFFIDIAVPRDIDPDVNQLDNAYLYDIDDLKEVVEENLAQRRDEAEKASAIVGEEVQAFSHWLGSLELQPTIVDLLSSGERIAQRELQKTLRRLGPDVPEETRKALEVLVTSLAHKLYHEPIVYLKRRAREEGPAERFVHNIRRIFNLDEETVPEDAHVCRHKPSSLSGDQICQDKPQ